MEMSAFDLERVTRHRVFLVTRLAQPGAAMKFPVMPRTDYVLANQMSLSKRTARMIADSRDDSELSIVPGNRQLRIQTDDFCERSFLEIFNQAQVVPWLLIHFILLGRFPGCRFPIPRNERVRFRARERQVKAISLNHDVWKCGRNHGNIHGLGIRDGNQIKPVWCRRDATHRPITGFKHLLGP